MRNLRKYIYLPGLLLTLFGLRIMAQEAPVVKDSSSIFEHKKFLDHQVVSPFGKPVSKTLSTTSVSTIMADDIRSLNAGSISNALAGKLNGLYTGAGYANSLQIRGVQTFLSGADGVKVLVDGFETDWNTLLPDEIESISVLKDAASLAQYGISGANGVVYIKTKTGQTRDRALVTFNSRVSLRQPTILPKFVNNGDYAELYNIAMISDEKDIANGYFKTPQIVDHFKTGAYPVLYPDVDWYDEVLKPSSIGHDYTLGINGGQDNVDYNVVLGYSNTPGIYDGVDGKTNSNLISDKYVTRINLNADITEWLRAEVKARAMISSEKSPDTVQNVLWSAMGSFLPYNIKTPDGEWGGTEGYPENPVGRILQKGYYLTNTRSIDANVKVIADLPFVDGISIFGQMIFSNNFYSLYQKTRGLSYQELFPTSDTTFTSILKGATNDNFSFTQRPGTQWNRTNILGGLEYNLETSNGQLHASAIYLRELYTVSLDESNVPMAKINLMGRVNYSLQGKYVAEFGYSYSGTDNYAAESRFGFFPSVSAAWVLSNESFLSGNQNINFLKLRASAGLVGNDQIGDLPRFMFLEPFGSPSGGFRIGDQLGTNAATREMVRFANPDATWEKAQKANIGLDAQLFNKLSVSADYFMEKRSDIFVDPANNLSVIIGGRYNYLNLGLAKNSGAEIEMMYQDKAGALGFYLVGRASYVKTEIVDSKEPPRAEDYLYRKGNPIGQPFVLEAIGFFADSADIASSPFQTFGAVKPGDVKYKDQNGDGFIDDNDVKAFGNPGYPSLIYSLDGGLEFMGFDVSLFIQGVTGRTISLLSESEIVPFLNGNRKPTEWVKENYWTPEKGNDALFPRLTTETNNNNYRASTLWQRDGSYLRIRNIEIGYSLPVAMIQKMKIERLRIYVNAANPFTISKITEIDVDPEINNPYTYPLMKSYNLGLTLNF
jgi:TonB-linked SusC/RagA family outer membrane protein